VCEGGAERERARERARKGQSGLKGAWETEGERGAPRRISREGRAVCVRGRKRVCVRERERERVCEREKMRVRETETGSVGERRRGRERSTSPCFSRRSHRQPRSRRSTTRDLKSAYFIQSVSEFVLQKSIPTQIRQLILCISNSQG
jgi:hypothetical protein